MSAEERKLTRQLYWNIAALGILVVLAGVLGWILGDLSVRDEAPGGASVAGRGAGAGGAAGGEESQDYVDPNRAPLFLATRPTAEGDWTIAAGEIALAAEAGVHQIAVPARLFPESPEATPEPFHVVQQVINADPRAAVLLQIDLNPPKSWLAAHPQERMVVGDDELPYASPSSALWRAAVREQLSVLLELLKRNHAVERHVLGFVFGGLEDGFWRQPPGHDRGMANRDAFRAWLEREYRDDASLQAVWSKPDVTLSNVTIPDAPPGDETTAVFLDASESAMLRDFRRFTSEAVAESLASFAAHTRELSSDRYLLLAPYGYSLELTDNSSGHFGLALLLESEYNGFISPVSYVDRGLEGAGGMMGPVNTAQYHGKNWYLIDDTRTTVTRDPLTGAVSRIKGIRAEDVYNVQRRNFTFALVHGLGLLWSDPQGDGWLHDEEQWEVFGALRNIYVERHESRMAAENETAANDAAGSESKAILPPFEPQLLVVVDEEPRHVQQCAAPLNTRLLVNGRDAALRAGVATQFCLLQDVLDDLAPPAPAYLFLNIFVLTAEERAALHERLSREGACGIWMYAPGYFGPEPDVEFISECVQMQVRQFSEEEEAGSQYVLGGPWLDQGATIGTGEKWKPLFYVDDASSDVVATYLASEKTSVALRLLPGGWTSIYVAEPSMSPALLRELLTILEIPLVYRPGAQRFFDTTHVGGGMLGIHAQEVGERNVILDGFYDVVDLFDADVGFQQKESFLLSLGSGESALLSLTP